MTNLTIVGLCTAKTICNYLLKDDIFMTGVNLILDVSSKS